MKFFLFTITIYLSFIHFSIAQTTCGNTEILNILEKNIAYSSQKESKEQVFYQKSLTDSMQVDSTIYTIPVVIHLVHQTGESTPSDEQILDGLEMINQKFKDVHTTNVQVEFCLAQRDINETDTLFSTTNGITRIIDNPDVVLGNPDIETVRPRFTEAFPRTDYLNIFLVNTICSEDTTGASSECYAGISPLAFSHGEWWDVVMIRDYYWNAQEDRINRVVHELGHYLHLYHTFEGGCLNDDCLLQGDQVCDTPPANSESANCERNSCTTDANENDEDNPFEEDQNDLTNNYMDFSNTACQDRFTAGQKDRMRLALTTLRSSLLSSDACMPVDYEEDTACVFTLDVRVLLEGAYNTVVHRMNTTLYQTQQLPLSQPYDSEPFFYEGNEAVESSSDFPLFPVDWVLVEIRQGELSDTSLTPVTQIVEQQAAILLPDGKVVNLERKPLRFQNLIKGENYYIVIRHRNHLAIMSPAIEADYFTYYNFTTAVEKALGFTQQIVKDGRAMMRAGDFNADGVIQVTDGDLWLFNPAIINTYTSTDATLDGVVQLTDYDAWGLNKAKLGFVEIRY